MFMLKKNLSKILNTILLLGSCGIIFSSCDNFLNSGDIREEIINAIDYNNAATCTVFLKADIDKGSFLSDGEKTFKIDYESEVQFSVNQQAYVFKELEAVSKNDPSISRSDCVEFSLKSADNLKGIYHISIKIIKEVNDILIRPVCIALPTITEITPKFESSGCDQDSTITITFNKAVKTDSFRDENGLYSCLSIYCDDGELSSYFGTPYFSNDNKTLYIPTNSEKLILPPDGTKKNLNINVKYDFSNTQDCDGNSINISGIYQYKINQTFGNQRKVNVLVESEEAFGKFLSSGEKECTVGYTIEIQFTVKKDIYHFSDFEAVSSGANHESRADCIEFLEKNYDEDTGVYKARVRVIEGKNDILIRPVCIELPKVTEITPKMESTGCDQDTVIAISFNKPMDPLSFIDSNGKYSCFTLTSFDGDDLKDYFSDPVFSSDNRTLYLKPLGANDIKKLMLIPDQAKNSLGIKVQYNFANVKDSQGLGLTQLLQNGSHEYKINKTYGQQKIVKVQIETDTTQGKFLSSGEKECYVGYTFDVQFTLKKTDYIFKEFEAVSNSVNHESRADCVDFIDKEYDEELGVYKAKVRVTKEVSDILIRPGCRLIPKLAGITPEYNSTGCDQDTEIQISFNKSVNPQSFGNFSCLTITSSDGDDLTPYFAAPYFSFDSKTICIKPLGANNNAKLLLPPESTKNNLNIRIQYDFSTVKDIDGIAIEQSGSHEYKIKKDFENQKKVNVSMGLSSDADYGSFFPSGAKECVVDYDTDLQFTVNNEKYKFIGLTTNHPESVTLTPIPDNENNIYKYKLCVTDDSNDILIRPLCLLRPAISKVTPATNDKKFANIPITITFNQKMEDSNTSNAYSIFKYGLDNISLMYGDFSVSDCFEAPVFDNAKQTLTIRPKNEGARLNEYMENQKLPFIDIKVSFGKNIAVTKDGVTMPLVAGSDFTVTYKAALESDPPSIMDFLFSHDQITATSDVKDVQRFSNKAFTGEGSFTADDVISNFTYDGIFYIYGHFYDTGVGVKSVTITQKRTYENATTDTSEIALNEIANTNEYTNQSSEAQLIIEENGNAYFCKKIELNKLGIWQFDVNVTDACGNSTKAKSVSVIYRKDFMQSLTNRFYPFNHLETPTELKLFCYWEGADPKVYTRCSVCGVKFDIGGMDTYVTYKNKNNEIVTEKFTERSYYRRYCHILNVDKVSGLDFTISVAGTVNNKETVLGKIDYKFPEDGVISSINSEGTPTVYAPGGAKTSYKKRNDGIYIYSYIFYLDLEYWDSDKDVILYSDYTGPFTYDTTNSSLQAPNIRNITYTKSNEKEEYIDINITLDDNWKDTYDCVSIKYQYPLIGAERDLGDENTYGYYDINYEHLFDGSKNVIKASIPTKSFYWYNNDSIYKNFRNDVVFSVTGTKNGVTKETRQYTVSLTDAQKLEFDNVKPRFIRIQGSQNEKLIVSGADMESGIKNGVAEFNGKSYSMSQSTRANGQEFYDAFIPLNDLKLGENIITVTITDNNNNTATNILTANYKVKEKIIDNEITHNNTEWKPSLKSQYPNYYGETILTSTWYLAKKLAYVYFYDFNDSSQTWNTNPIEKFNYNDVDTSAEWKGLYYYFHPDYRDENGDLSNSRRNYAITGTQFLKVRFLSNDPELDGKGFEPYCYGDDKKYSTRTSADIYNNYEIYYTGYDTGDGSVRGTGKYNMLYKNGTSKESVVLASDAPVLIHTLVTSAPYSEAKEYSRAQWESLKEIGTKQINFTTTNHDPLRYNIPTGEIQSGQSYIVIAHYADDSILMSEVMQK